MVNVELAVLLSDIHSTCDMCNRSSGSTTKSRIERERERERERQREEGGREGEGEGPEEAQQHSWRQQCKLHSSIAPRCTGMVRPMSPTRRAVRCREPRVVGYRPMPKKGRANQETLQRSAGRRHHLKDNHRCQGLFLQTDEA